ncbi:MAG TPA: NADPH:quinone oxidoreductase family protein [Polyangiaceae bacterium]|nr:NADPH:quinone oxidoreductase family protein [Polyangiaceae bacterium]
MKAIVCHEIGPLDGLRFEDVPDPKPVAGQVLIGVRACGLNFPDVLVVQGKYQFKAPPPFTPGGEVSGVVEAVGSGVTDLKVGDRVVAVVMGGGLAEKMVADASQVHRLPDGIDFATASCVLMAYGTALHALRDRAAIRAGETLLVTGAAGGVGLGAVQIGKRLGARVIAAASTAEKLETARKHGADLLVNYATEDLKERVKSLTDGQGADVVFDPVGGPYTEQALRATARKGRVLIVGFTAGEIPRIPTNLVLLKDASLVGVFWGVNMMHDPVGGRAQLQEILGWVKDGSLRPFIQAKYPLPRGVEALRELEQRRAQGRIVVVVGGEA